LGLALAVACHGQGGAAIVALEIVQGPRQAAMGWAGVAVPDAARSSNFNPAMPGLSFGGRATVAWHPSWNQWFGEGGPRMCDWNGPPIPDAPDLDTWLAPLFFRWPAVYLPRFGYLGYDRQKLSFGFFAGTDPDHVQREEVSTLTWAAPEDLFRAPADGPRRFAWTFGVTAKRYESVLPYRDSLDSVIVPKARGFAMDAGVAARWREPFRVQGLEGDFGLAFLNLGPSASYSGPYSDQRDPLPMEYRAGFSAAYVPLPYIRFARREWSPLKLLATAEAAKDFAGREPDGAPMAPPLAFFHDMRGLPGRYLNAMAKRAGTEATAFGIASLRWGWRFDRSFGRSPFYSFGYGLSTGPLLRHAFAGFDWSRDLATRQRGGGYLPRHQWSLDLGYAF
jgi:hypothetical protein